MISARHFNELMHWQRTALVAFGALIWGLLFGATTAIAQDLGVERSKVLREIGKVQAIDIQLSPVAQGIGLVFRHEINEASALNLRLHFLVKRAGQAWGMQIRDQDGAVAWTWDGEATANGFWSDEVPGKKATVEVFSSIPNNTVGIVIDKVVFGTSEETPVSIVGPNQLSPITVQDAAIANLGKSVARLRFIADDGRALVCSAFLVTSDLMFTNQHCIATETEMESALVDFDFDSADTQVTGVRLRELVESDFGLDYSVIRLRDKVARTPLRLSTSRPADRTNLLIIQHPAGEPKQVSIADCGVSGALVNGRDGRPTDFGHTCDTKGGSSGSPVFDRGSQTVVGLHHLGIPTAGPQLFNRAIHMDLVIAKLTTGVKTEIEADR